VEDSLQVRSLNRDVFMSIKFGDAAYPPKFHIWLPLATGNPKPSKHLVKHAHTQLWYLIIRPVKVASDSLTDGDYELQYSRINLHHMSFSLYRSCNTDTSHLSIIPIQFIIAELDSRTYRLLPQDKHPKPIPNLPK